MRSFIKSLILAATAIGLATACGDDEASPVAEDYSAQMNEASRTYVDIVTASYADSLALARELDTKVNDFVERPSQARLEAARQAWRAAREPYLQTEVYRFYNGPIDNPEDGPEGLLNAWPMDESFVDYVLDEDGEPDYELGLINDRDVDIDAETLAGLNEDGGEENIATGYHAVEFLLWGQDVDEDGPGARPYTDFITGDDATAPNGERRGQYLRAVSGLIVTHLEQLSEAWAAGQSDNYRAEFEAATPKQRLERILTGMIVLSGFETGGERLQTALDSHDQEDEHSCFSDNTHRDMVQDVRGIQNVWLGRYQRLDGSLVKAKGVRDVVNAKDPALATELDQRIETSLALAEALQAPFDQEISAENPEGNERVRALITSLRTHQERLLERVFHDFGLSVPVTE
jgi:putative iron-regulated protein